jgi:hypothetical protein
MLLILSSGMPANWQFEKRNESDWNCRTAMVDVCLRANRQPPCICRSLHPLEFVLTFDEVTELDRIAAVTVSTSSTVLRHH